MSVLHRLLSAGFLAPLLAFVSISPTLAASAARRSQADVAAPHVLGNAPGLAQGTDAATDVDLDPDAAEEDAVTEVLEPSPEPAAEAFPAADVAPASLPIDAQPGQRFANPNSVGAAANDAYLLGPGDVVRFDIFDLPEITNQNSNNRLVQDQLYTILVDGTINLPWIGRVRVEGLNLQSAADVIAQRYTQFVVDPVVTLTLFTPRPVRVAVVGEVRRPGAYTTAEDGAGGNQPQNVGELRTVIQAIQTAGGITQQADIRNIEVRRPDAVGSAKEIKVDLWALLRQGAQDQNLLLRDGDTVLIPTATVLTAADYEALGDANFSPESIGVDVVGEVDAPGRVEITPNSTLNQAIMAAGGFDDPRARSGSVDLIRVNPDGTVTNRQIAVNLADGVNEATNPPLRRDDIVIVSRSGTARASDFLTLIGGAASAIINPILGITNIFRNIDEIGNNDNNNN